MVGVVEELSASDNLDAVYLVPFCPAARLGFEEAVEFQGGGGPVFDFGQRERRGRCVVRAGVLVVDLPDRGGHVE